MVLAGQRRCADGDVLFVRYPAPAGFAEAKVKPAGKFYDPKFCEFMLPYDVVRTAEKPDEVSSISRRAPTTLPQSWESGIAKRCGNINRPSNLTHEARIGCRDRMIELVK